MMLGSSIKRPFSIPSLRPQSVTLRRANVTGARYWLDRPLPRRPVGIRRHSDGGAPPPPRGSKASKDSLFSTLLGRYTALLESRPLTTKAITSGVIAFAGDISCQLIAARAPDSEGPLEEIQHDVGPVIAPPSKVELDWGRCARFTFLGTTLLAPALHYWYGFLLRRLPGTAVSTVVVRVSLDQLVFAPAYVAVFLSSVMILEGNAAKIASKLRADYATTLVGNWGYWIPAQIINFRFVRPVYQVLFSNCCGIFWSIYLSYQSNKALEGRPSDP